MKIINENLKEAGIVNTALLVIAIVLMIAGFDGIKPLEKIGTVSCIIALLSGLYYAFSGYKKSAVKYYKLFFELYGLSSLLSLANTIIYSGDMFRTTGITAYFICYTLGRFIVCACVFILAFAKDLGKVKSTNLSFVLLAINMCLFLGSILQNKSVNHGHTIANVILACIVFVFVSAKYEDKEKRGSK